MPPPEVLDEHVVEVRDDHLDTLIWNELRRLIDFDAVVRQIKERHPEVVDDIDEERVREWFDADDDNRVEPWSESVDRLVDEDIEAVTGVRETVRELLIEQLDES